MVRKFGFSGLLLAGSLLAGCGGDSNLDGDATQAEFKVQAVSSPLATARASARAQASLDASGNVTVTAGRAYIGYVQLEAPEGMLCTDLSFVSAAGVSCEEEAEDDSLDDSSSDSGMEAEIKLAGPVVYDLITGAATPAASAFSLPSGTFHQVKIELREANVEDGILAEGDPLLENSFEASGTFVGNDSVTRNFTLRFKFNAEIEFENEAGVAVTEGGVNAILAALNVQSWFAGVDMAQCVADGDLVLQGDGSLLVDENTDGCSDIRSIIKENIKNSFEFEHEDESADDSSGDSGADDSASL